MTTATAATKFRTDLLSDADRNLWDRDGILLLRGLLSPGEVQEIRDHFDDFVKTPKTIEHHWYPVSDEEAGGDPLKRYPRVLQPHAFMELGKRYMLHERIGNVLAELLQDDPIATQSMYYFKPSGAKGQALHQDNYYLRVKPFNCVAAWCAIDPATPENGGMSLVPGTKDYDIQCPRLGDATPDFVKENSFSHDYVAPPEGTEAVPYVMQPGDVLFFNGSVIHGSTPNTHPTLWRRSFICHYMPTAAKEISGYYHRFGLWDFEGNRVDRGYSEEDGGPCGHDDAAMQENLEVKV